eukprot:g1313.t1
MNRRISAKSHQTSGSDSDETQFTSYEGEDFAAEETEFKRSPTSLKKRQIRVLKKKKKGKKKTKERRKLDQNQKTIPETKNTITPETTDIVGDDDTTKPKGGKTPSATNRERSESGEKSKTVTHDVMNKYGPNSKAFLKHLEQTWALHENAVAELETIKGQTSSALKRAEKAEVKIVKLENINELAQQKIKKMKSQLAHYEKSNLEYINKMDLLKEQHKREVDRTHVLTERIQNMTNRLSEEEAITKAIGDERDSLCNRVVIMEKEVDVAKEELYQQRSSRQQLLRKLSDYSSSVERLRSDNSKLHSSMNDMACNHSSTLQKLHTQIEKMQHEILRLKSLNGKTAAQEDDLKREVEKLQKEVQSLQNVKANAKKKIAESQDKVKELKSQLQTIEKHSISTVKSLSQDVKTKTKLTQSLKISCSQMQAKLNETKQALHRSRAQNLELTAMAAEDRASFERERVLEVQKKFNSLKVTADAFAKENITLGERVKTLEEQLQEVFHTQAEEIEKIQAQVTTRNAQFLTQRKKLEELNASYRSQLEELKVQHAKSREALHEESLTKAALSKQVEGLTIEIKALENRCESHQATCSSLEETIKEHREKESRALEKLSAAKHENELRDVKHQRINEAHEKNIEHLRTQIQLINNKQDHERKKLGFRIKKLQTEREIEVEERLKTQSSLNEALKKLEFAINEVQNSKDIAERKKVETESLRIQKEEMASKLKALDDRLQSVMLDSKKKEEEVIPGLKNEITELKASFDKEKRTLREKAMELNAELAKQKQIAVKSSAERKLLEKDVAEQVLSFSTNTRKLHTEMGALENANQELTDKLREKEHTLQNAVKTLKTLREELISSEEEALAKVNRVEHENMTLKAKLARCEAKRKEELEKAKQSSRIAKKHVEEVQKETRRLDGESEQQRFEIDRLSREVAILTSENQGLKRKLTRYQRESRSLKQIEDSMSAYLKQNVLRPAPLPTPTETKSSIREKKQSKSGQRRKKLPLVPQGQSKKGGLGEVVYKIPSVGKENL